VSPRSVVAVVLVGVGVLGLAVGATRLAGDSDPLRRVYVYPRELPPGPGQEIAVRSCQMCHSAMLITQQHKDSSGWERTITQMEKWGAPVPPEQRDSLRTYLNTTFGPAAAPK